MIDTTKMTLVVSDEVVVPDMPFVMGFVDGLEQPFDLTSGVTWDDSTDANESYDRGVNVGQNLMRLLLGAFA